MISRSSLRHLKHKAKKSVMLKIGRTVSSQEDPAFKDLLANINLAKSDLKDMYQSSRSVIVTGRQHNDSLQNLCGAGLKGEDMFNKEDVFLRILEEHVCLQLGKVISKDIEMLDESIVEYKTAKLKFDSAYFKTLKNIKKNGESDSVENADEIIKANTDLPALKDSYNASKGKVFRQRDVLLSHLNTRVKKSLEELSEASDRQHHQMYCQYIMEKLTKIYKMCADDRSKRSHSVVNQSSTKDMIENRNRAFSENILRAEDEKMTMIDSRLLPSSLEIETKDEEVAFDKNCPVQTNQEKSEDHENSASVEVQTEQKDNVSTYPELQPPGKPPQTGDANSDNGKMSPKSERGYGEITASPREESL